MKLVFDPLKALSGKKKKKTDEAKKGLVMDLVKAGPYIGPRGGKWADPQHKIPWHDGKKEERAGQEKVDKHGGVRKKGKDARGKSVWYYSYPDKTSAKVAHKYHTEQAAKTTGKTAAAHKQHAQGAKAFASGWGKLSFVEAGKD